MKRGIKNMSKVFACAVLALATSMPLAAHGGASNYSKPAGVDLSAQSYKDGSYQGTAVGFRDGLRVEVTVKGGKVTAVKVIDHNEVNRRFYDYPIKVIPVAIVKKQSTDLDAVSGASATSYGIMAAVENALEKAK